MPVRSRDPLNRSEFSALRAVREIGLPTGPRLADQALNLPHADWRAECVPRVHGRNREAAASVTKIIKKPLGDEYAVTVNPYPSTTAAKKANIVKATLKGGSEAQGSPASRKTLTRSN
jgi:hypothetical protein